MPKFFNENPAAMLTQVADMCLFLASVAEAHMNPEANVRLLLTEAGIQLGSAICLQENGRFISGLAISAANLVTIGMALESFLSGNISSSFYLLMGNTALNGLNSIMALWTGAEDAGKNCARP